MPRGAYVKCSVSAQARGGRGQLRYVLVTSPKPSGTEILPERDSRYPTHGGGYVLREHRTEGVYYHHEVGNRMNDSSVWHMELAGGYVLTPALVEAMYEPETRGHSGTFHINVADGGPGK